MSKLKNFTDTEYKFYPSRIIVTDSAADMLRGFVYTKYGIVQYNCFKGGYYKSTRLTYIKNDREYNRQWDEFLSKKTIAQLAREFVEYLKAKEYASKLNEIELESLKGNYKSSGAEAAAIWEHLGELGFCSRMTGSLSEAGKLVVRYC